jgi:OOP family OmpA-OmpF porin
MPIKKLFQLSFLSLFFFLCAVPRSHAQDYKIENGQVIISEPITFKTASAILTRESDAGLKIIKRYLEDKSYISTLRIECHSDDPASQALTEKRALAVSKALVDLGVDCKRLIAVGFGASKPIEDNSTPEGKAANRRVTLVNAALRGRAIGGLALDGGGVVAGDPCN